MLKAHSRLFKQLTFTADVVLISACWVLAYWLRFHVLPHGDVPPFFWDYALQLGPILLVWSFAFNAFDLYRPRRLRTHRGEWWDIAKASTLGAVVLITIMSFLFRGYDYSRVVIGIFWASSIVAVTMWRVVFREALRVTRRHGYNVRYAVVVGDGETADEVFRVLKRRHDAGVEVLGRLGDKRDTGGTTWLGAPEDIRRVLDESKIKVDMVIVALPYAEYSRLTAVLNGIGDDPVSIHLVPEVKGLASLRGGFEEFAGIPFLHLRESPLYGWSRLLKRVFDVAVASAGLFALSPLLIAIAATVKLSSPGPVLYRQERMGLDGRRFSMLKFRSMVPDAEAQTGPRWAVPDDPRRTRFGAFLRRTSLDELPQLLNVLRGEMSLVGPRPERPSFVEEFRRRVPRYLLRHKMKAGITGWAQVNGLRGNTSLENRIKLDLEYIEKWSFSLDLKILWKTVWVVFRSRNAY
ncbi:MAG TPA: undecaprenyl-phosphate glucose phosphotransferase [Methylomirabilota bacterium]|nr:undecaprenyl-phosphate glucose phosphotransferase [Methylomirabilota bacterium]